MTNKPTIILQQVVIADYRMGVFLLLREHWGQHFDIIAGDYDFTASTRSTPRAWDYFTNITNRFLFKRKLLWQSKAVSKMLGADVLIISANVRNLSNIAVILLRKFLGRKTIYWGHAYGKFQADSWLRNVFLRFADGFIAYTETQRELLQKVHPHLPVWAAPNSCVFAADCAPLLLPQEQIQDVIYVGRLIKAKKVTLLLEGFANAVQRGLLPEQSKLIFVGDGTERETLQKEVEAKKLADRVIFTGHVSDTQKLRQYYAQSICSASPGGVGLSATQSFSFGVPMVLARDERHGPEVEACKDGFNTLFCESGNAADLADKLADCFNNREHWLSQRQNLAEWTKTHYSFEAMRNTFVAAVERIDPALAASLNPPAQR